MNVKLENTHQQQHCSVHISFSFNFDEFFGVVDFNFIKFINLKIYYFTIKQNSQFHLLCGGRKIIIFAWLNYGRSPPVQIFGAPHKHIGTEILKWCECEKRNWYFRAHFQNLFVFQAKYLTVVTSLAST